MTERLEFTLKFPNAFLCGGTVLGIECPIIIENARGVIAFPERANEQNFPGGPEFILNSPRNAVAFDESEKWGYYTINNGQKNASINCVQIWIPTSEKINTEQMAFKEAVNEWYGRLTGILELLSGCSRARYVSGSKRIESVKVFLVKSVNEVEPLHKGTLSSFDYRTAGPRHFITRKMLQEAVNLANETKELRLEYILLLSAVRALGQPDTRKSVLDSATALEVCLTQKIDFTLQKANNLNPKAAKDIMGNFRTLTGRVNLAKILGINLANTETTKLVDIRNETIHGGHEPSVEEAKKLFDISKELILKLSPLLLAN